MLKIYLWSVFFTRKSIKKPARLTINIYLYLLIKTSSLSVSNHWPILIFFLESTWPSRTKFWLWSSPNICNTQLLQIKIPEVAEIVQVVTKRCFYVPWSLEYIAHIATSVQKFLCYFYLNHYWCGFSLHTFSTKFRLLPAARALISPSMKILFKIAGLFTR